MTSRSEAGGGDGDGPPPGGARHGTPAGAGPDAVREAVLRNPRAMTLRLARELGVPEVEVIRAFPAGRATELEVTRWEGLVRAFEHLGPVRVLVSNVGATLEVEGAFGGFSTTWEFFNVQTPTLDLHVRWPELAAAFAVEKPGHVGGAVTRSFQFFDRGGAAVFKVFLNFGGPIAPRREEQFLALREEYRKRA
jgi:putative heme degradation protein